MRRGEKMVYQYYISLWRRVVNIINMYLPNQQQQEEGAGDSTIEINYNSDGTRDIGTATTKTDSPSHHRVDSIAQLLGNLSSTTPTCHESRSDIASANHIVDSWTPFVDRVILPLLHHHVCGNNEQHENDDDWNTNGNHQGHGHSEREYSSLVESLQQATTAADGYAQLLVQLTSIPDMPQLAIQLINRYNPHGWLNRNNDHMPPSPSPSYSDDDDASFGDSTESD
jgi:hypothetical protein